MKSYAVSLKCFSFLFLFGLQSMRVNDPLTHGPAPSAAHVFGSQISSTPGRCSRCAEYSSRVSDLEARLTLAKRQAQMAINKASKACDCVLIITKRSRGHTGGFCQELSLHKANSIHWFDRCYGGEPVLAHYPY
jgi:hypothetical protein